MAFPQSESAKWAQANSDLVGKYAAEKDKLLTADAARGFAAASGDTLSNLLEIGQVVKGKLAEANAKIYEDRRKVLFEQDTFAMELVVKVSKLAMTLYAAELIYALTLEEAANTALRDQGTADVVRLNAEVDKRQVAMIQARAEAERRVVVLKDALVDAETGTLTYESALVQAQIKTAEEKLKIIESIYAILAAEELVLAAENRRAATLTLLLAAQLIVAGIKKEMIPFYLQKASARQDLAAAITAEIPITEAIINLGYDRIALKDVEEDAAHRTREAEEELELLQAAWTRANKATELTRTQARRLLQEYTNTIQGEIMAKKKSLTEDGIDLDFSSSLARQAIGVNNEVELSGHEVDNLSEELVNILANITAKASDEVVKIDASATTATKTYSTKLVSRKIIEGSF